jgi:phage repressor protein C with HTH and peptisase S24 domain
MRSVLPDRVRERMELLGFSQRSLAKAIGVEQPTINRLLNGEVKNPRFLHLIAPQLQTSVEYLTGATDEAEAAGMAEGRRSFAMPGSDIATLDGLVPVKEIDLMLGAGGTYLDDGAITETTRYFPRDWLREFTDAPADMLVFARVKGDSMKPTLLDGAIVIIDLRRKRINEQDEVWSIAIADIGMVKRIWANPDGSYKIKSDNPNVGPESAHDDEMFVIGRVVASIGKH